MFLAGYIYDMEKTSMDSGFVGIQEASDALGISTRRTRILANEGKFAGARKIGRDWIIPRASIAGVKVYGKSGRPPKQATGTKGSKK